MSENIEQIAKQCDLVSSLSGIIAEIFYHHSRYLRDTPELTSSIEEKIGNQSALLIKTLEELLVRMYPECTKDDWMVPIIEKSNELYPHPVAMELRELT